MDCIQRNAIISWTLLRPRPEIILLGEETGTSEIAKKLGLRYEPKVDRNEQGTPLLSSLFQNAEAMASQKVLCYVNADIILMSGFMEAVEHIASRKSRFLMVGQRWDVHLKELWDFSRPDWPDRLQAHVRENGSLHPKTGIDYFVFPRGLCGSIPPFAIGRTSWDNWLIYQAWRHSAAVVDATRTVFAVHQNHDYGQFGGKEAVWNSKEARRNRELAQGCVFTLEDVTHKLLPEGMRPVRCSLKQIARHLWRLPKLFPLLRPALWIANVLLRLSRPIRSAFGLTLRSGGDDTS